MERMCDMCGIRPATSFTSYTVNGVTTKQCLCSECAKKYSMAMDFRPDNIIASVFGLPHSAPRTLRVCNVCGATERDILDNYEFGCSECYKTFPDLVDEITSRIGIGAHVGKRPLNIERNDTTTDLHMEDVVKDEPKKVEDKNASELDDLKRQLRLAVDEERFDDASKLKKKIDKLKAKGDK